MTDQPLGPGWWQASNGKYYPPEARPDWTPPSSASTAGPWATDGMPSYQHGPYAFGAAPPQQGTNGLAIASLICSLVGLCTCVTVIAGVVLGHVALSQFSRPDNHQEGRGLAIAGLAIGYVCIGLFGLWILFVVALG